MSEKNEAPAPPGEVWRGKDKSGRTVIVIVDDSGPRIARDGGGCGLDRVRDPAEARDIFAAWALSLRAAALSFQRACGCVDGGTLSAALYRIKHILREGDGIIPSPCEGIQDAAERVVKRAERAEKLAARERAYRVAIEDHIHSGTTFSPRKDAARVALIEAGGEP